MAWTAFTGRGVRCGESQWHIPHKPPPGGSPRCARAPGAVWYASECDMTGGADPAQPTYQSPIHNNNNNTNNTPTTTHNPTHNTQHAHNNTQPNTQHTTRTQQQNTKRTSHTHTLSAHTPHTLSTLTHNYFNTHAPLSSLPTVEHVRSDDSTRAYWFKEAEVVGTGQFAKQRTNECGCEPVE